MVGRVTGKLRRLFGLLRDSLRSCLPRKRKGIRNPINITYLTTMKPYLPDPNTPLHEQTLLGVTPRKKPKQKEPTRAEVLSAAYNKQEQDSWDRYYKDIGEERPNNSQSPSRIERMIG